MGTHLPDQYLVARSISGLPTCTFPPASFARNITSIVVKNSVDSTCNVYRGLLNGVAAASTPLGGNNTLAGPIRIPAGQPFFVQWSAAGASVTDASARVYLEGVDNPLESDGDSAGTWARQAIISATFPSTAGPNDPSVIINQSPIPPELITYYGGLGATVIAVALKMQINSSNYLYDALITAVGLALRVQGQVVAGVVEQLTQMTTQVGTSIYTISADLTRWISGTQLDINGTAYLTGYEGSHPIVAGKEWVLLSSTNAGNTNSVAFVDYPGPVQVTIGKQYDGATTYLFGTISGTFYSTVGDGIILGARVNGVDYISTAIVRAPNPATNQHTPFVGHFAIGALAAGSYTVRLRWACTAGANITVDANDTLSFIVEELGN